MSSRNFSEVTVPLDNTGESKVKIIQKSVTEIFRFGTQPYLVLGASGGGKTVLSIDIIFKYSKQCTNIYYITSTKESIRNTTISKIPKCFRREPHFNSLSAVWAEIKGKINTVTIDIQKLISILVTLYGIKDAQLINDHLSRESDSLMNERIKLYTNSGINQGEALTKAEQDAYALKVECLSRLIVDKVRENGVGGMTTEDILILNSLVSVPPKTILILDDISSEIASMSSSESKVRINGGMKSTAKAYKELLIDILTKSRHFNCLICFFLHDLKIFDLKSMVCNLVIFDRKTATTVTNSRSLSDDVKRKVSACLDYIFIPKYKYFFMYIGEDQNVFTGISDVHVNDGIQLDSLNKAYVEAYTSIESGITPQTPTIMHQKYDNEYDDDEEVEPSQMKSFLTSLK